ncbi:formyl transferase, partial [Francisella tularensis subsp. holarctica]|nr:formyl transferase [Francisella tularensis subsp. holarctica]
IICIKNDVYVDYFCSFQSQTSFAKEIYNSEIKPIVMKKNGNDLIGKYDLGFSCHSKQLFTTKLVNSVLCINIHPGLNPYNS